MRGSLATIFFLFPFRPPMRCCPIHPLLLLLLLLISFFYFRLFILLLLLGDRLVLALCTRTHTHTPQITQISGSIAPGHPSAKCVCVCLCVLQQTKKEEAEYIERNIKERGNRRGLGWYCNNNRKNSNSFVSLPPITNVLARKGAAAAAAATADGRSVFLLLLSFFFIPRHFANFSFVSNPRCKSEDVEWNHPSVRLSVYRSISFHRHWQFPFLFFFFFFFFF